jgi:protein-tyrosine kinase
MSIVERTLHKVQEKAQLRIETLAAADSVAVVETKQAARPTPSYPAPTTTVAVDRARLASNNVVLGEEAWHKTNEFRRLKWPLLDAALGRDANGRCGPLLLVTSSEPGEGKTFVAINLALSVAAEQDKPTLLVDGDLAKPHLTDIFGLRGRRGLTDLLADPTLQPHEVIVGTDLPGLRLLPAGTHRNDAPELLSSGRMEQIQAWLTGAYTGSIVVFDSPPLLATNEAQVLSRHVGQVLLVVRADVTLQPVVQEAVALLDKNKRLSATLNQARMARMGKYYGAYYGMQKNAPQR